jgi:DNA replication protein DnaC
LEAELKKIRRYKLIIIDEVGYIPFDQDAANLFFQLIASRYERGSVMVTSNLPFGRWGETFSDDVAAAAMIDRLVHRAEVLTLTGDSYRPANAANFSPRTAGPAATDQIRAGGSIFPEPSGAGSTGVRKELGEPL